MREDSVVRDVAGSAERRALEDSARSGREVTRGAGSRSDWPEGVVCGGTVTGGGRLACEGNTVGDGAGGTTGGAATLGCDCTSSDDATVTG